jgi:5-oxoprolinase (ATP-hydrolysing)
MSSDRWLIAIDRGGTFTDVVAHGPTGEVRSGKVLARAGSDLEGVAAAVGMDRLPDGALLRVGTTVGTNALLTNTGALTAALVTPDPPRHLCPRHRSEPFDRALGGARA